jgi:hypothetical protein
LAITWAHDSYRTEPWGSAAYRAGLSLHIKEVTEAQARGSYTTEGKTHSIDLGDYIRGLMADLAKLSEQPITPASDDGEQTFFTLGNAPR